jgi:outer membrane protein OmpA-like peptidoglycan-associated protein
VVYSNFEKSLELKASRKLLTLNVTDSDGNRITLVDIEVKNLNRDENVSSLLSYDANKNPILALRTNNMYELDVTKKGYTYFNTTLDIKNTNRETQNIVLDLLTTETKMIFNNITFETNSAELNTESYAELNRLLSFMERNPNLKIEIAAHTDDIGSNEYNFRLSDKRAESVVKFLVNNNINKSRVQSKGYGELQPLAPNDSDENRARNRRVEIKIIENTTN